MRSNRLVLHPGGLTMFLEYAEFEALEKSLDLRYCHPCTAVNPDPELSKMLDHARTATESLDAEENAHEETREELARVVEMVRDIALQMERKSTFNCTVEPDHAEDLRDYADMLREVITLADAD
jgi:hypothetical protein